MASLSEVVFTIYDFIAEYHSDHGQIPSLVEIAAAAEVSVTTVTRYLDKMETLGMIERHGGKARAMRLLKRIPNWDALVSLEPGEVPPGTVYHPPMPR